MTVEPEYVEEPPESRVELDPFARYNWKTVESKESWDEVLDRAAAAKSAAEWRSMLSDDTDRKAAIIHVNNYNREKWLKRVGKYGLEYRDIRYSEPYDGYAHKFHDTDIHDPERNTYAVIAQNADVADKMEEAELELGGHERHDTVGEMLGFPECCRNHFNDIWVDNYDRGLTDPMYEAACNTPSAEIVTDSENIRLTSPKAYTNTMWRYFGWAFITHLPCSFECEESAKIGKQRHEIMKEAGYGDTANKLYTWLDQPFVWDGLHSIANIRNKHVTATAGTSSYWSKKRIEWRREHFPRVKPIYTAEDAASINF